MLTRRMLEPVLAPVGVLVTRLGRPRREPVRTLPAGGFAETRAARLEPFVQARDPYPPRCLRLPERPMHRVEQTERFARPFAQIFTIALERHPPAHIHIP